MRPIMHAYAYVDKQFYEPVQVPKV